MINELAESALEELKRADHSIYVSLKYTRTVDIIKNTIKRLLSAYDISIIQGLEYAKEQKKLQSIPVSSRERAELIIKLYPKTKKSIEFYFRLKNVDRADFTKKEEYRKNVALIAKMGNKIVEVNTEELRNYFDMTACFSKGMSEITVNKKFVDAQKVGIAQPIKKIKKPAKKPVPKDFKKTKKGSSKKIFQKAYKINPNAKITGGFNRF